MKVYGIVDKTGTGEEPRPWLVPGVGKSLSVAEPGLEAQADFIRYPRGLAPPGNPEVVDADLADYFGSIPHSDLLKSVARRVVDRRVLHLIKMG